MAGTDGHLFSIGVIVVSWLYWGRFDCNITGFFRIGSEFRLSPLLNPDKVLIVKGEVGYDGQQMLSIALDPGLNNQETILSLDNPAYRYRRILYPILGYLLGGGNPFWIPWALVGINVIALAVCTGLIAFYHHGHQRSVYQSMWFSSIPGIWMVLSFSTADLLAGTFGLGAIISAHNRRTLLMLFCLAAGLLTRETLFILWSALLLTHIQKKQSQEVAAIGVSILPLLTWLSYIYYRELPGSAGLGNFGLPFEGIAEKFQALITAGITKGNLYEAYLWGLLWLALGWFLWQTWRSLKVSNSYDQILWRTLHYTGLGYLSLLLFASFDILDYYLNYSRVFLEVFIYVGLLMNLPQLYRLGLWSACVLASLVFVLLTS